MYAIRSYYEMPEFTEMYKDRTRKMVLHDRNHPSILFWSAGNESGEGENITEVIKEGKKLDPTRYWMYGGNEMVHPAEDIIGPRYPSPLQEEINLGMDTTDNRPSFMDEYRNNFVQHTLYEVIRAPWEGNQALLWKQPQPLHFAEIDYKIHPNKETLEKWAEVVNGTVEYMVDFLTLDKETDTYHIQLNMGRGEWGANRDNPQVLGFWHWGIEQGQIWRERMGLKRNKEWDTVRNNFV